MPIAPPAAVIGSGEAARLAAEHLSDLGDRWLHVQAVGQKAEELRAHSLVRDELVVAAWLHDLGYSECLSDTGFHPLDGARFLARNGAPAEVIALVAWHSGADVEAEERQLLDQLVTFTRPSPSDLDVLNFIDMTTGPTGLNVRANERLGEILRRYPETDPVHRAVRRSRSALLQSCARAHARLREGGTSLLLDKPPGD